MSEEALERGSRSDARLEVTKVVLMPDRNQAETVQ